MPADEPNPHLLEFTPGSWDPPFRKWILGVLVPVGFAIHGSFILLTQSAQVLVLAYKGRFRGLDWIPVEGAQAITWGLTMVGLSILLHGRYHWRYRNPGWTHFETIQGVGAILAVIAFVATYAQIWAGVLA